MMYAVSKVNHTEKKSKRVGDLKLVTSYRLHVPGNLKWLTTFRTYNMANTDMRVLTLAFFCLGVGGVEVEDFLRSFMPAADLTELTLDFADLAEPMDDEDRLRARLAGEGRD